MYIKKDNIRRYKMKLTIKTQSGQKVVDLNSDLQFNTIKGEQYVFSNGFSNYVLNFKDNQESVTLTFNVNGKSIKVELNGIVPILQANTTNMPDTTAIIINKDLNEKDVDSIVENNSFDGGEIIDRLEALLSKPVELGDNVSSNLTLITIKYCYHYRCKQVQFYYNHVVQLVLP